MFLYTTSVTFTLALFFAYVSGHGQYESHVTFSWKCEKEACIKQTLSMNTRRGIQSRNACKLLCGDSILWPKPQKKVIKGPTVLVAQYISDDNFLFDFQDSKLIVTGLLNRAIDVFIGRVGHELEDSFNFGVNRRKLKVRIAIKNPNVTDLTLSTKDEAYTLTVNTSDNENEVDISIEGETFFGARHGLETLSQLIVYDDYQMSLVIPSQAQIEDEPAFPYRGIMLDTARNYFSVQSILRTIDIMSSNKLNTFHWHITDSQSFPIKLEKFPRFADYGAYNSKKVYTEDDIKLIVDFAKVRGVRIVPELDAPAHAGEGWQSVPDAVMCLNKEPWSQYCGEPVCGQLNPLKDIVYETLGHLYSEYRRLFQSDLLHMGGDEVWFSCWRTSRDILDWIHNSIDTKPQKKKNVQSFIQDLYGGAKGLFSEPPRSNGNEGYFKLWSLFQERAHEKLKEAGSTSVNAIVWTSELTSPANIHYLKGHNYIIQVWSKVESMDNLKHIMDNNHRIILSNSNNLYLDCGVGNWLSRGNNWCSPYNTWQQIYENKLQGLNQLPKEKQDLVLGQEAPLWSETVSEGSLDPRLWPRASALAERTWTNPESDWHQAQARMFFNTERLTKLGANVEAVAPEWCNANSSHCNSPYNELAPQRKYIQE